MGLMSLRGSPAGPPSTRRLLEPKQGDPQAEGPRGVGISQGHCQKSGVGWGGKREGAKKSLEGPA